MEPETNGENVGDQSLVQDTEKKVTNPKENTQQNGWMSEQQIKEAQRKHSSLYNGAPLFIPECCKKIN